MTSNPLYDPYRILMKVYGEKAYLKQAIADTYIEELYRSRTVKAAYGVIENDAYFTFCIARYAEKSPKLPVRVLLKTALYFLTVLGKKRYAVTDFAVELCKKLGKGGAAGFVNAFLRKFDEEKVQAALPEGEGGVLVKTGYPAFAYQLLREEYGKRAEKIAEAKSAGVSVRFLPPVKENAAPYFEKAAGRYVNTTFAGGVIFENFSRDSAYDEGKYTFQSVGSQAICGVIEPCGKLLDACAAPGGKSVLLAEKCGEVTAFELHAHRAELITAYARRAHRENITAVCRDSRAYDNAYEKAFDAVLCDVPCSGFGTVSENPDIKILKDESVFSSLADDQRQILQTCSRYVKEGGMLYYSTCSLFARENDGVVAEFLKNNAEFSPVTLFSPLAHEKKKFGLQFLPDTAFGAGFYVAAMRRSPNRPSAPAPVAAAKKTRAEGAPG
ncbi:MAG: transcription antitermination factor NusB, partial [Candidatus Scatosoma sp.]